MKKIVGNFILITMITVSGIFTILGYIVGELSSYICEKFSVGIDELIYTCFSPKNGANTSVIEEFWNIVSLKTYHYLYIYIVIILMAVVVYNTMDIYIHVDILDRIISINIIKMYVSVLFLYTFVLLVFKINSASVDIGLSEFITSRLHPTTIYEEYYVSPDDVNIGIREKKNLIYIYVESLETTYADKNNGGTQENNLIPQLTDLAKSEISFSNKEKLGGAHNGNGNGWTMGSIFSMSSGIPFSFPINGNDMENRTSFAPNVITIGDILDRNGYKNFFMCGSDSNFAGRRLFLENHGNYEIYDYYTAVNNGDIPKDYYVWWGFEDKILYELAKKKILALYESDKPFNFTMITADTHMVDGYKCELCENNFEEVAANVIYCTDKQIAEFVSWCRQQIFFEDTVIVITGDHPRMDDALDIKMNDYYDRTIYNCFINCQKEHINDKYREFTPMDMFPTTLSAMGFEIEGNRLGLGTNLFSDEPTLAEMMGFQVLDGELAKHSKFYDLKFQR